VNELTIIREAFLDSIPPCENPDSTAEWARFGFYISFKLFKKIRHSRLRIAQLEKEDKSDGSPTTNLENEAETFAKQALAAFYPDAHFLGEELGAFAFGEEKILLLIDPIDGTRSFLSGFDTYSLTISILKEKKSIFSLVCSPSTGDFGYRIGENPSKVFQFPLHSEDIEIVKLPYIQLGENPPLLVNIHPSLASEKYLAHLYNLWKDRKVSLVKSVSGSPSLLILEAAKGGGVYLNTWSVGKTMPFDLIPSMHILLGAGGHILGLNGKQINPWNHQGMYFVGLNKKHLDYLIEELIRR
jgi:3'(2'), 5'-bisphosphate nucleotidase